MEMIGADRGVACHHDDQCGHHGMDAEIEEADDPANQQ
jgi:hypothetical protein